MGSRSGAAAAPGAGSASSFRTDSGTPNTSVGVKRGPTTQQFPVETRGSKNTRVDVVVRKRPLSRRELEGGQHDVIACTGNKVIVREPKLKVDLTRYVEEHVFPFDCSFDENATNKQLYCTSVRPSIEAVFQGSKCTCFAYGQTGSGKTYTMIGPPKSQREAGNQTPGIFLLAAHDIFRSLNQKQHAHLSIFIAFYEIYCGKLFDLLNNRQILHARENAKANVVIVGLQEHAMENVQELMEVIEYGLNSRTTGTTGANADSSRSHAILQIRLKNLSSKEDGRNAEYGKISFIDFAGSERGADTGDTDRQTRMDGAEINKSLLALKECIRALDHQHEHTPFRGSKLTQVLKDSFTGSNCRTVMIANVSPCSGSVEHSLNTLRYGWRVKELRKAGSGGLGSCELGPSAAVTPTLGIHDEVAIEEESEDESPENETPLEVQQEIRVAHLSQAAQTLASSPLLNGSGDRNTTGNRSFDARSNQNKRTSGPVLVPVSDSSDDEEIAVTRSKPAYEAFGKKLADSQKRNNNPDSTRLQQDIAPEVALEPELEPVAVSSETLEELARRHDRLIGTILTEEEELISEHREHIDRMVELLKEEMVHLNTVDRPGSDVDAYVANLDHILRLKAQHIAEVQKRVDSFKEHLLEEDALSRKFQSLSAESG